MKKLGFLSIVAAMATVMAGRCVLAAEYWVKSSLSGSNVDWTSPSSYQLGANDPTPPLAAPTEADEIVLPKDFSLTVASGTAAYSFLSSIVRIQLCDAAQVEICVADGTVQWNSAIMSRNGHGAINCKIVKTGAGRLELTSADRYLSSEIFDYQANIDVREGVLRLPDASVANASRRYFSLNVERDAKLVICNSASNVNDVFEGVLTGSGTIDNETNSYRAVISIRGNETVGYESAFYGKILNYIQVSVRGFYLKLLGNESTYSGETAFYREGKRVGGVGYLTWGGDSGMSSLGVGGLSFADASRMTCLASEPQYGSKSIYMNETGVEIDGGNYGGLTINPTIGTYSANTNIMELTFCGSNTEHACVYTGRFKPQYSIKNPSSTPEALGELISMRIIKNGPGIWRFDNNTERRNAGVFEINEGTFQFDSIAEAGTVCSLGLSTALFDKYTGPYDPAKRVDHAFELGGTDGKVATFEYVGNVEASCSSRKLAMKGDGRLLAENGSLSLNGVGTLKGANATLRLAGSSTGGNSVGNIEKDAGRITLIKEGSGTWTLNGNQTFAGDVIVKEGTLNVSRPTSYNWYRFILKENYNSQQGATSTTWQGKYFEIMEVGIFDKDGNRINKNLAYDSSYASTKSLAPGSFGLMSYNGNTCSTDHDPVGIVDDDVTTQLGGKANSLQLSSGSVPMPGDSSTWPMIVMRLANDAGKAVAYDIVAGVSATSPMALTLWTVEGSFDGVNWTEVAVCDKTTQKPVAATEWYNGNEVFVAGATHVGYGLAGYKNNSELLTNVETVEVCAGATLKTVDAVELKRISFGDNGAGVIDGFAFAENGLIKTASRPKTDVVLPGTFRNVTGLSNVTSWSVDCGGRPFNGTVSLVDGKIMLRPNGFAIILR